jgi:hypothetical protein
MREFRLRFINTMISMNGLGNLDVWTEIIGYFKISLADDPQSEVKEKQNALLQIALLSSSLTFPALDLLWENMTSLEPVTKVLNTPEEVIILQEDHWVSRRFTQGSLLYQRAGSKCETGAEATCHLGQNTCTSLQLPLANPSPANHSRIYKRESGVVCVDHGSRKATTIAKLAVPPPRSHTGRYFRYMAVPTYGLALALLEIHFISKCFVDSHNRHNIASLNLPLPVVTFNLLKVSRSSIS